jgi:hypothetical protein
LAATALPVRPSVAPVTVVPMPIRGAMEMTFMVVVFALAENEFENNKSNRPTVEKASVPTKTFPAKAVWEPCTVNACDKVVLPTVFTSAKYVRVGISTKE